MAGSCTSWRRAKSGERTASTARVPAGGRSHVPWSRYWIRIDSADYHQHHTNYNNYSPHSSAQLNSNAQCLVNQPDHCPQPNQSRFTIIMPHWDFDWRLPGPHNYYHIRWLDRRYLEIIQLHNLASFDCQIYLIYINCSVFMIQGTVAHWHTSISVKQPGSYLDLDI